MTTKTADKPTATALVVERKHLTQALAQVMPATAARGTSLPVLSGVRFEKDGDRLRLTATDLEVTVSTTIPADVPKSFDVVVQARLLQRLVKEAAGPLTFTLNPDTDDITVTWGRTVAILKNLPLADWPKPATITEGTKVTLTASDVQMVRRLANFASRDDCRPILTGIRFGGDPHGAVATDSYRLAIASLEAKLPKKPFLLPARVARFLPMGLLDTETCVITIEPDTKHGSYATLDVGEVTIRAILIDGEFPPFQNLIPKLAPCHVTFNLKDLHQAVRSAGVIATEATPVRLAFDVKAKTASVVGIQQDVGQLSATVDILSIEGSDPVNTCAFNSVYLQELLASLTEESVTLEIIDTLKPMTVREGAWTLLIMPVRVS